MSETIITQRCYKCKVVKPLSEFSADNTTPSKHKYRCKTCDKAHRETYRNTEHGRLTECRYRHSRRGRQVDRRAQIKQNLVYPHKRIARNALHHEVRMGRMPSPSSLQCKCGKMAAEYHHHNGYSYEHRLDVIPVCTQCHIDLHQKPLGAMCST